MGRLRRRLRWLGAVAQSSLAVVFGRRRGIRERARTGHVVAPARWRPTCDPTIIEVQDPVMGWVEAALPAGVVDAEVSAAGRGREAKVTVELAR